MDISAYVKIDPDTLKYITKDNNSINSDIISNEFESFSLKQNINEYLKILEIVVEDGSRKRFLSKRFGEPLTNPNPFATKYHCHCIDGLGLNGRINAGLRCPKCGYLCEYIEEGIKNNEKS